ncbi:MAG: Lon-like protease [Actinomycetota bacterium]|nr:Lon-like protease [Actinomycetota bacterium]
MAIFPVGDGLPRSRHRGRRIGWILIVVAVVGAVVVGQIPSSYVIEEPGPVYNTIGTTQVDSKTVPVLTISGAKTYPTSGALDMLTVNIEGDPDNRPNWSEIVTAYLDPSKAVTPIDEIYAPQETVEQSNKEGTAEMVDSQQQATAAALFEQHIPFTSTVTVDSTQKGSPAAVELQAGDILRTVNGKKFVDADQLHQLILDNGTDKAITVAFSRKGVDHSAQITPEATKSGPFLGVFLFEKYTFPFPVKVQLQDVGGPSAGMMFALGIIDKLTPGELNGGKHVAGTGTISAYGVVGAIGGIRQKMYGARAAGATYFLAPASNCNEVRGHIPAGLTVYATSTLHQSVVDLQTIAAGTGLNKLKTCG